MGLASTKVLCAVIESSRVHGVFPGQFAVVALGDEGRKQDMLRIQGPHE